MNLEAMALKMLREDSDLALDARRGAPLGNSVAGSLLSLTTGGRDHRAGFAEPVRCVIHRSPAGR
jgi:hypothetical protein